MTFNLGKVAAPVAEKRDHVVEHHGKELHDSYAWLRADNWQDVMRDPQVLPQDIRDYLEAENTYYETLMEDTKDLQDTLFDELKARVKQDDSSVPSPDGPFAYASRYEEGKEYPLFTRTAREGGEETILFDGPKEAEGTEYFALGLLAHSPDHQSIAWSVDTNGSEFHHMRIRDLETGKDSVELVRDVGSFQWCPDSVLAMFM